MSNKGQMLQDPFLNTLRKEHVPVSIYLVNGIKLQGQIESFDQYVVLLKNTVTQMVYKHAISTVVPARSVAMPHSVPIERRRSLTGSRPHRRRPADGRCRGRDGRRRRGARPSCMFERPAGGDRALLVALDFGDADPAERMAELDALAVSAGATVVGTVTGRRQRPDAATYAGKGKVEEIAARRAETGGRPRHLQPPAHRRAAAQPRAEARMPGRRPDEPDPRHLRAARAKRRGQAAGRARAGQAPAHAARRRLDPPRAAKGRHRPPRPGRERSSKPTAACSASGSRC